MLQLTQQIGTLRAWVFWQLHMTKQGVNPFAQDAQLDSILSSTYKAVNFHNFPQLTCASSSASAAVLLLSTKPSSPPRSFVDSSWTTFDADTDSFRTRRHNDSMWGSRWFESERFKAIYWKVYLVVFLKHSSKSCFCWWELLWNNKGRSISCN